MRVEIITMNKKAYIFTYLDYDAFEVKEVLIGDSNYDMKLLEKGYGEYKQEVKQPQLDAWRALPVDFSKGRKPLRYEGVKTFTEWLCWNWNFEKIEYKVQEICT